jgi:hypothetical protein
VELERIPQSTSQHHFALSGLKERAVVKVARIIKSKYIGNRESVV